MPRSALALAATALLYCAACSPNPKPASGPPGSDKPDTESQVMIDVPVSTYACDTSDGSSFVFDVRQSETAAQVALPQRFDNRKLVMARDQSSPGKQYRLDNSLFWVNEGRVRLDVDGVVHVCTEQPANAVHTNPAGGYKAVGQEPGWTLEIAPGSLIDFKFDYGEKRVRTPVPDVQRDDSTLVYHAVTEANDLRVEIARTPCNDPMSGHPYPDTVRVTLNGREFSGCGGPLPHSPASY